MQKLALETGHVKRSVHIMSVTTLEHLFSSLIACCKGHLMTLCIEGVDLGKSGCRLEYRCSYTT